MGNEFLAAGAEIMCPAGTLKIQQLKIPIEGGVLEGGRTVARETDCQPVTNIDSFGVCAITQQKCVPKYLGNKWMNTEEATFLSFNIPAPTMESYLFCMTGQLHVKPISSGQDMIKVDTLPEILLEMIKELLAFFHIEINEFDLDEDKVHELMMGNIAAENMPQATVPLAALVGIALTLLKNYLEDQGIEFGFGSSTSLPSADDLLKNAGILQQAEADNKKDTNQTGTANAKNQKKETVTTNKGKEIDVTPSEKHTSTTENPSKGEPNSSVDIYDKDGNLVRRRWYDEDGKASRDVDMTNHGNSKNHPEYPHEHTWDWSKNPPRK